MTDELASWSVEADSRRSVGERLRASVVIPAFRRVDELRTAVLSVAAQRLVAGSFEMIIADDGSAPYSEPLARELAHRFERLTFVTGPNAGPGVARNRGVACARADVVAFLDSDCIADPGWLEAIVSAVEASDCVARGPMRSSVPRMEPWIHTITVESSLAPAPGANLALRRLTFERLGGFSPRVSRFGEDHEFTARALQHGVPEVFVDEAVVQHPPRLKRFELPFGKSRADAKRWASDARSFLDHTPSQRAAWAAANRRLLLGGTLKWLIAATPAAMLPICPPVALSGYATFFAAALLRRRRTNEALERAGEPFRVPLGDALQYGAVMPVLDLLTYAERVNDGLGFLWTTINDGD
jgi:GT2 family glycosyltransferase